MSFRKITFKSGNEEFTLEVTEEEYLKYYRPWWQQKKHGSRGNGEAMGKREKQGGGERGEGGGGELGVLQDAMDSLLPEERELAAKVFGEEMSVCEYARVTGGNRRTLDFRKNKVMEKLRHFFPGAWV